MLLNPVGTSSSFLRPSPFVLRRGRWPEANRSQDIALGDSHRAEDHTQSREYTMCVTDFQKPPTTRAPIGVCAGLRVMRGHAAIEKSDEWRGIISTATCSRSLQVVAS